MFQAKGTVGQRYEQEKFCDKSVAEAERQIVGRQGPSWKDSAMGMV